MKKMFTTVVIVGLIALLVFRAMPKPSNALGLVDGKLAPCPSSPNCVCSEYAGDTDHSIAPIPFTPASKERLMTMVIETVTSMNGSVHKQSSNYLSATFTTGVFRFVDDFEVKVDEEKGVIQLRSASQLGRSDFGVNRKRVDMFKTELLRKLAGS